MELIIIIVAVLFLNNTAWFVFLYLFETHKPRHNSKEGQLLREDTENGIARTIPHQKQNEARIRILRGLENNARVLREQLENDSKAVDDATQAAMDTLNIWVRK